MKFTEEKLEKAFTNLLGPEGFPYHVWASLLYIPTNPLKYIKQSKK